MIGDTGSGKSTLLKQFLPELLTGKVLSGQINSQYSRDANHFAYVSQFVDNQIVMETPKDELEFVLDNQGCNDNEISMRIAEIASYLGIVDLLEQEVSHLSGGQKQLVNLASALVLKPQVLLLDEPTAQLDPVASEKLLQIIHKLNQDFNLTVLLVEHEIEKEVSFANRLMILEKGKLILDEPIKQGLSKIFQAKHYRNYLTQIDRLALELNFKSVDLPLSNQQLTKLISKKTSNLQYVKPENKSKTNSIFSVKNLSFRFDFNGRKILNRINFQLEEGGSYCIVGPNGVGKTTLLKVLTQQLKPQTGKIKFLNKKITNDFYRQVFVLPQNPANLFIKATVKAELEFQLKENHSQKNLSEVLSEFSLEGLEEYSPYDLSGGQQEFLALALGFIKNPKILFLDEPTKGLDPNKRILLSKLLKDFQSEKKTVLINSHDLLFAADYADYVAMMFNGNLSQFQTPSDFFADKFFYTTEINKALRDIFPQALIWKDIKKIES